MHQTLTFFFLQKFLMSVLLVSMQLQYIYIVFKNYYFCKFLIHSLITNTSKRTKSHLKKVGGGGERVRHAPKSLASVKF